MAVKKKVTKKTTKTECDFASLKLLGTGINLIGVFAYAIFNVKYALTSAVTVLDIRGIENYKDTLAVIQRYNAVETFFLLGDVCLFEFVNHFFYIKKNKEALIGMFVLEIAAFILGGVYLGFTYPLLYVTLLPLVTGIINFVILSKE